MAAMNGGMYSFYHLSLEYNVSSSPESHRFARSKSSWKAFQETLQTANTSRKGKFSKLMRFMGRILVKLRNGVLRLVRLGMFYASPEDALFWLFVIIIDHIPVDMNWFFDSEDWETLSDDSFGLSSCGSWSSFMHRSDSGVGPPPPPHGNFFLKSWSRKFSSRVSPSNSIIDRNTNEVDAED